MASGDCDPPGPPPPARGPAANLDAALRRLRGDRELLGELIRCFQEDSPKLLGRVAAAADAGDFEALCSSAHSLKGLSANFDATPTVALAAEVERAGKERDRRAASDLIPRLRAATEELARELAAFSTRDGGG